MALRLVGEPQRRGFWIPAFAGMMAVVLLAAAAPAAGTLTVDVRNVRNDHGRIRVDVCPQAEFLGDGCTYFAEAPAHAGTTSVVVHGLPAGRYAVQIYHDENGNGRVDRALFGIPKEGVGFSRDARIGLGPPKWRDAEFDFDGGSARVALTTRYFLGPSGPGRR